MEKIINKSAKRNGPFRDDNHLCHLLFNWWFFKDYPSREKLLRIILKNGINEKNLYEHIMHYAQSLRKWRNSDALYDVVHNAVLANLKPGAITTFISKCNCNDNIQCPKKCSKASNLLLESFGISFDAGLEAYADQTPDESMVRYWLRVAYWPIINN
jgi:hypothetical protein